MKELSIEQKAKRYDEALARAREIHSEGKAQCHNVMTKVFPEIKEIEDERIRRLIIKHFKEIANSNEQSWKNLDIPYILAWLEKQGETNIKNNNPVKIESDKFYFCIKDYFAGGCCRSKNGDVVLAKNGMNMMGLSPKEASEYFIPVNHFNENVVAWFEKQGEPIDKIVKRAMNEKQRVLLTDTNGNANIDWDTRSLQDVKLLLEYGLDYIKKLEKQGEQKSVNKAESKSKIIKDTWYVCTYTTCTEDSRIWFRKDIAYLGNDILKCNLGFEPEDYQKCFRLWTIEDAKEGDVLANDKSVFIYAKVLYSKPYAYCGVDKFGVFKDNCLKYDWSNSVDNIHPATKEQRDLLFQ